MVSLSVRQAVHLLSLIRDRRPIDELLSFCEGGMTELGSLDEEGQCHATIRGDFPARETVAPAKPRPTRSAFVSWVCDEPPES